MSLSHTDKVKLKRDIGISALIYAIPVVVLYVYFQFTGAKPWLLPVSPVGVIKGLITLSAHSSIPWDKPFYKYKILHPVAWVLERVISTPATHHAHHADTLDDGVGNYKGNFGNMFFLWDVIFKTGIITRKYPKSYGIKFYKQEEWYAQFLWPIFKSKKEGSELSKSGPEIGGV